MPELPEVETLRTDLIKANILNIQILDVSVDWEKTLNGMSLKEFRGKLIGSSFISLNRRGKYLVFKTDNDLYLLCHLRMSGSMRIKELNSQKDKHDRILFTFKHLILSFHDPRKFGRVTLTENSDVILNKLGVEPLTGALTKEYLMTKFQKTKRPIKSVLLDQSIIAGIGNIYADETLFAAKINPLRTAESLNEKEIEKLIYFIKEKLSDGIKMRGTSLGKGEGNFQSNGEFGHNQNNLLVFGKKGKPCPICSHPIEKKIIGQRGTHYCPICQI